jgi:Flp pilus assembly pilin Flp
MVDFKLCPDVEIRINRAVDTDAYAWGYYTHYRSGEWTVRSAGRRTATIFEKVAPLNYRVKNFWADEAGLTTVEYALLLALLVIAALTVWTTFGATVRNKVAKAGNSINGIS